MGGQAARITELEIPESKQYDKNYKFINSRALRQGQGQAPDQRSVGPGPQDSQTRDFHGLTECSANITCEIPKGFLFITMLNSQRPSVHHMLNFQGHCVHHMLDSQGHCVHHFASGAIERYTYK
jgi:hypothetical protein